ncbi:XisI protein, partial [Nostoc sp. CALU 1950]|uniref:XisI protein n=1 Tax=Nostoc sp. CALU 1950 TaxID=3104321 RepID=UPI003EC0B06E
MDTLDNYRQIIQKILDEYAQLPYAYGELERQLIIDQTANHYLLLTLGWENNQRVHGCLVHIGIIKDKIWIQRDGTEYGSVKTKDAMNRRLYNNRSFVETA